MMAFISGKIVGVTSKALIVATESGLGYEVKFHRSLERSEHISLYLYHSISEQDQSLWGFESFEERELFKLLLTVNKVGPAKAYPIVTKIPLRELILCIMDKNIKALQECPGIGDKMAQQIVLTLSDKIEKFIMDLGFDAKQFLVNKDLSQRKIQEHNPTQIANEEARSALINLGFKERDISNMFANLMIDSSMSPEDIIKLALKQQSL